MPKRLPVHNLDAATAADGQVPVVTGGKFGLGYAAVETTAEAERIRDVIGAALRGTGATSVVVNDPGDLITISSQAGSPFPALQDRGAWSATPKAQLSFDYELGIPAGMTGNVTGYPVTIDAADATTGTLKAMIAGLQGAYANEYAEISIVWAGTTSDTMTVRYWCQSEAGSDFAKVYVDGVEKASQSGVQSGFLTFTFSGISPGTRVIRFSYTSDYASQQGFNNARWGKVTYWGPDASAAYMHGHVVSYGGLNYFSLVDNNIVTPGTDVTKWLPFGGPKRIAMLKVPGTLAVAAGTTRIYNDTGATWTISSIRATVETAPTGGTVVVDVNKNGTTLFTTQANRPTIASAGLTSGKVTNADVTTVADGDYLTVDVDTTTSPAADLTVSIVVV